ncbi:hypothetical protein BDZ85DRAFT_49832 [Elsinoe ampelina]|uniref:Transmembrane protein n=1 Tax=Elsinoe ampelina TaxID=302913 RepID=A0A6A6GLA3_9PEZI|nr:hypothetical protein BDZ85DRAFT_49832 [Elsinoe ampelina]
MPTSTVSMPVISPARIDTTPIHDSVKPRAALMHPESETQYNITEQRRRLQVSKNLIAVLLFALLISATTMSFFGGRAEDSNEASTGMDVHLSHKLIARYVKPAMSAVIENSKLTSFSTTTTTLPPLTVTITLSENDKPTVSTQTYTSIAFTLSPLNTTSESKLSSPDSATGGHNASSLFTSAPNSSPTMTSLVTELASSPSPTMTSMSTTPSSSDSGQTRPTMSIMTLDSGAGKRAFNPLSPIFALMHRA